jgi:hypothetical protein
MTDQQYNGLISAMAGQVTAMDQDTLYLAHWSMGLCLLLLALVFMGVGRLYRT